MKVLTVAVVGVLLVCAMAQGRCDTSNPQNGRQWRPEDSPAVRYVLIDQSSAGFQPGARPKDPIVVAPDGKHFFFVAWHGDLECDCNVYELSVYSVSDVMRALRRASVPSSSPAPVRTITMRNKFQAIESAQWEPDGKGIFFFGYPSVGAPKQLYLLSLASDSLRQLTHTSSPDGVQNFVRQGDALIYNSIFRGPPQERSDGYPAHSITQSELSLALTSSSPTSAGSNVVRTFAAYRGGQEWDLHTATAPGGVRFGGPWFSPRGDQAIMVRLPSSVPAKWMGYNGTRSRSNTGERQPLVPEEFPQFMLIDLVNKREDPLLEAPTGEATQMGEPRKADVFPEVGARAFWSTDGTQLVLVNAALPLPADSSERARTDTAYILSYDMRTRQAQVLEPLRHAGIRVSKVEWVKPGEELAVRHEQNGKPTASTVYALRGSRWVARSVDAVAALKGIPAPTGQQRTVLTLAQGLKVQLKESSNDPPAIVASTSGRDMTLSSPDPALQGIWIARTAPVEWRDREGVTRTSGLLMPRELPKQGARLPLVIQLDAYEPNAFRPDGATPTGFAAQALVAQGMAVLNLDIPSWEYPDIGGTPKELPMVHDWMESSVAAVAKKYPIDVERIGLIGFSHTAHLTYLVITHPGRLRIGAAVVADGFLGSYGNYLQSHSMGHFRPRDYEREYGSGFYQNKQAWLEQETSFNVDRVEAASLFTNNGDYYLDAMETIGAFVANRRPFDYVMFPRGTHQLSAPRQRAASVELSMAWMMFWLQNREDPDPAKAERYERWRAQRALNEQRLRETATTSSR